MSLLRISYYEIFILEHILELFIYVIHHQENKNGVWTRSKKNVCLAPLNGCQILNALKRQKNV